MAPRPYDITLPAQVRALASGIRQEIVDAAESLGPCSVAELGKALGRRPDTLYYHVRLLLRVGLLVDAGRRDAGRRTEALLRTPGRPMQLIAHPGQAGALAEINRAMMRLASRDYQRAASSPRTSRIGPAHGLYAGRTAGRLTAAQLKRVARLMKELQSEFVQEASPKGRLHAITLVLVPLAERDSARRTKGHRP